MELLFGSLIGIFIISNLLRFSLFAYDTISRSDYPILIRYSYSHLRNIHGI